MIAVSHVCYAPLPEMIQRNLCTKFDVILYWSRLRNISLIVPYSLCVFCRPVQYTYANTTHHTMYHYYTITFFQTVKDILFIIKLNLTLLTTV